MGLPGRARSHSIGGQWAVELRPAGTHRRLTVLLMLVAAASGADGASRISAIDGTPAPQAGISSEASMPAASFDPAPDGTLFEREFFLLPAGQRPLELAHGAIVVESFVMRVAGEAWQLGVDFHLQARSGQVIPMRSWADEGSVVAVVEYRFQPGLLQGRVGLRPMLPPPAEVRDDVAHTRAGPSIWMLAEDGELQVRGSKGVQVTSGSRRDLTVAQNLRLSISGQLTRDISVQATLTDDNLPVVPEGNTERLADIDQVLVTLTAPAWTATLGDFVARRDGTLFGGYRRKLQGFSFEARPGLHRAEALFGSPRGRYRTIEIRGQEANQGPYFLGAGATGRNLFVVAGSERVVMDGQLLTRGSDRDYVIDYVRGTVTFTYRRLVTSETLIVVEFEEGEGAYGRTVVGGGAATRVDLGVSRADIGVRLIREADDAARLRSGELTDQDEAILRQAGADPFAAVAPGAVQVEPGRGDYVRHEVDGDVRYEFVENDGDWQVVFFFAGQGLGDYKLTRLTETGVRVYTWVGLPEGSYRVGRLLPLPEAHTLVTLTAAAGDSAKAGIRAEWHLSSRDRNVLSALDDEDNEGKAAHLAAHTGPLAAGGGILAGRAAWRWRDDRFASFQMTRSVHDYEGWGLGDRARRPGFFEVRENEALMAATWQAAGRRGALDVEAEAGRLEHGESLSAKRLAGGGSWRWLGGRGYHRWRRAASRDESDPLDIERREQAHGVGWRLGPVQPRLAASKQSWRDEAAPLSRAGGWRLEQFSGGLAAAPDRDWLWDLQFTRGLADSLRNDVWRRERDSRTWQGSMSMPRLGGVRAGADVTVREVRRPAGRDETTRLARLEAAGRWPGLGSEWSLGYAVDNSRTEVLARQVAFVGEGQGRYDEGGNFVGEGLGDYELLLAGTDSLIATTGVRADLNWRQDFAFLGKDRIWGAWQSETRVGVEARSRTEDTGKLLRLARSAVFDEASTVLGRIDFSEEVTLLRHLRSLDFRWRFDYSEVKDRQYAQGRQDRLRREHIGTLSWNPSATASIRLRGGQEDDRRGSDAVLNPTQLDYTTLTRRFESEGSWRPVAGSRMAVAVEFLTRDDAVSGVKQSETALRPSLRWRLQRGWSLQNDLRLSEVRSEEPPDVRRPYFFPSPGTNVDASMRISWDPNRHLGVSLAWFARKPGGRVWQHDLRLESTARF